jgi:acyl-coenzyme A synthetase/AMP-(fatty) acid ligase
VLPSEIEAVLHEHPAVQESGVAGVRDFECDYLSRAMIVLKPGHTCSERELVEFVASRLPEHKQLHGGVHFVTKLPESKGGKLDRKALLEMAMK